MVVTKWYKRECSPCVKSVVKTLCQGKDEAFCCFAFSSCFIGSTGTIIHEEAPDTLGYCKRSLSSLPVTDSLQLHEEGSINKSLLSVLSAMQENFVSSNSMLHDLVEKVSRVKQHQLPNELTRFRRIEPFDPPPPPSEKAQNTTSQEVNDNLSEKETDPASEENDELSQITTSLSSSDEDGLPVSDKLSKLVNV